MIKSLLISVVLLTPNTLFAADKPALTELNAAAGADIKITAAALPEPAVKAQADEKAASLNIYCSQLDATVWGKVTDKGATLSFRIWDEDSQNSAYLKRIASQTQSFTYQGSDQNDQISLTLDIPFYAFQLPQSGRFIAVFTAQVDGNDSADTYNLSCMIR